MANSSEGNEICYLLILLISVGFLVWGFVEMFRTPKGNETKGQNGKGEIVTVATISRQIRGFALIMLAQIVFVLGIAMCSGMSKGFSGTMSKAPY